ncbi:TPA: hypothetical protein R8H18_005236 [Citrobacter freundii]|uniref:hypothetical protein n=1 Tax=Klebsiella pneumoniae TaxID=573 RepID=UPI002957B082|nr:hypothetical protein [Citrobacter freundii]HEE9999899.1 hypothetical protein [Citrobacter freundii]HEF0020873.1 hypothetical protein [Citrobacter freundii]HEF0045983.1 hypothetical protein [Citrobacter freundii]
MLKILLLLVMVFLLGYGVFGLTAPAAVAFTVAGAGISFIIASFIGLSILAITTTVIMIGRAGIAVQMIAAQLFAIGAWKLMFSLSDSMKSLTIGSINIYEQGSVMLFVMSCLTCAYVVALVLSGRDR